MISLSLKKDFVSLILNFNEDDFLKFIRENKESIDKEFVESNLEKTIREYVLQSEVYGFSEDSIQDFSDTFLKIYKSLDFESAIVFVSLFSKEAVEYREDSYMVDLLEVIIDDELKLSIEDFEKVGVQKYI